MFLGRVETLSEVDAGILQPWGDGGEGFGVVVVVVVWGDDGEVLRI